MAVTMCMNIQHAAKHGSGTSLGCCKCLPLMMHVTSHLVCSSRLLIAYVQVGDAWKEYTESTKHYSKMHFEANKRMLLRQEDHKEFIA